MKILPRNRKFGQKFRCRPVFEKPLIRNYVDNQSFIFKRVKISQRIEILAKMEILAKNGNFSQKWKF